MYRSDQRRCTLRVLPSPLWGGVGGGGPHVAKGPRDKLRLPSLTLPRKGGGNAPNMWR
jgi:hypothetical protein